MPADRNLGTISIGIGVNLESLNRGLEAAKQKVASFNVPTKSVTLDIHFKSGWGKRQEQLVVNQLAALQKLADAKPLEFRAKFRTVGARDIYRDTQDQLDAGNRVLKLKVAADAKSAKAIHADLQKIIDSMPPIKVPVEFVGAWPPKGTPGGSGGGASGPSGQTGGGGGKPPRPQRGGGQGGGKVVVTPPASTGAEPTPATTVSVPATRARRAPRQTAQPPTTAGAPATHAGADRAIHCPVPGCTSFFYSQGKLDEHMAKKHAGTAPVTGAAASGGAATAVVATPPTPGGRIPTNVYGATPIRQGGAKGTTRQSMRRSYRGSAPPRRAGMPAAPDSFAGGWAPGTDLRMALRRLNEIRGSHERDAQDERDAEMEKFVQRAGELEAAGYPAQMDRDEREAWLARQTPEKQRHYRQQFARLSPSSRREPDWNDPYVLSALLGMMGEAGGFGDTVAKTRGVVKKSDRAPKHSGKAHGGGMGAIIPTAEKETAYKPEKRTLPCPACGQKFDTNETLNAHIAAAHGSVTEVAGYETPLVADLPAARAVNPDIRVEAGFREAAAALPEPTKTKGRKKAKAPKAVVGTPRPRSLDVRVGPTPLIQTESEMRAAKLLAQRREVAATSVAPTQLGLADYERITAKITQDPLKRFSYSPFAMAPTPAGLPPEAMGVPIGAYAETLAKRRAEEESAAQAAQAFRMRRRAEGGNIFSRPFGQRVAAGPHENIARANPYAWKKTRSAQINKMPWCASCGIGRAEARSRGLSLTADHIVPQVLGGDPLDPKNLTTRCTSCNSAKGYLSDEHAYWTSPRPNIARHDVLKDSKRLEWMPGGRYFGSDSIRSAMKKHRETTKHRAEGGLVGAVPGRRWHFVVDGTPGSISGSEEKVKDWIRQMAAQGHSIKPGIFKTEGPGGIPSHSSFIRKRAEGGEVRYAGLLGRMAQRGHYPLVTKVGEHGEELIVQDGNTGEAEVVPHHKVPTWIQRMQEGKLRGKDLTGAAEGIRYPKIRGIGGGGGTFAERMDRLSQQAELAGTASHTFGGVQRVLVVNWPTGMASAASGGGRVVTPQSLAGQPVNQHERKVADVQAEANVKAARKRTTPQGRVGAAVAGVVEGAPVDVAELTRLSASKKAEFQLGALNAQYAPGGIRSLMASSRQDMAQVLQQTALRSPTVAAGEALAVTAGGRGGIQARAKLAELAMAKQQAIALKLIDTQREESVISEKLANLEEERKRRTESGESVTSDLTDEIGKQTKALDENHSAQEVWQKGLDNATEEARILQAHVAGLGDKLRVVGANMIGVAGGMIGFGAAMTVAQVGMDALFKSAAPLVDSMSGFGATTQRVTTDLGKQNVELKGNTEAVFGMAGATAGLSKATTDFAQKTLGQQAIAKSAGMIEGQASQMIRATAGATGPAGAYSGYGGLLGGPLFAELMGGGKGFTEQIAGNITELRKMATGGQGGGITSEDTKALKEQLQSQTDQLSQLESVRGAMTPEAYTAKRKEFTNSIDAINKQLQLGAGGLTEANARAQASLNAYVGDLNDAAKRGASAFGEADKYFELIPTTSKEYLEALRKAGREAGDPTYAGQLADAGLAVKDATGKFISSGKEYEDFVTQLAKGRTMTDIATYAKTLKQSMQVQRQAFTEQRMFASRFEAPYNFGIARFASGEAQTAPATGINQFGVTGKAKTEIQTSIRNIGDMRTQLNRFASDGIARMTDFVSTWSNLGADFSSTVDAVKADGKAIATTQLSIFNIQRNLNNAQFANTKRLAARAYRDALGLVGKAGGADNLGAIQRQQTMLGFGLTQRQITTQLAIAQFSAPGQTGEERYMRQKQAIAEAKIAQTQLNLQRKAFGIETKRGVTDTGIQVGLIQKQWNAENELAAKSKELAGYEAAQATKMAALNTELDEAKSNWQLVMSAAIGAASEFGGTLDGAKAKFMELLGLKVPTPTTGTAAWNDRRNAGTISTPKVTVNTAPAVLDIPKNTVASTPGAGLGQATPLYVTVTKMPLVNPFNPSGSWTREEGHHARGIVGTTRGATDMTVGEAGAETVAVLRNPRSMSVGGVGGGSTFNISINYQGSGSPDDAEALARMIAVRVEQELSRKGQLLGLRGAAY